MTGETLATELERTIQQAMEYVRRRGESTIRVDDLRLEQGWLKDIFVEASYLHLFADQYIFELEISGRFESVLEIPALTRTLALDGALWIGPKENRYFGTYRYEEQDQKLFTLDELEEKTKTLPAKDIALAMIAAWTELL